MNGVDFQKETGKEISPIDNLILKGYYPVGNDGTELVNFKSNEKVLSDEAISFILMKEKEIKECEEEVKLAESNLKTAKKKLYSSKHCLESFRHSATNNTK